MHLHTLTCLVLLSIVYTNCLELSIHRKNKDSTLAPHHDFTVLHCDNILLHDLQSDKSNNVANAENKSDFKQKFGSNVLLKNNDSKNNKPEGDSSTPKPNGNNGNHPNEPSGHDGGDNPEDDNNNKSRLFNSTQVLISLSELIVFNFIILFGILLLIFWHLFYVLKSKWANDGYHDLNRTQSVNVGRGDELSNKALQQEGYSYTLPGLLIVRCIMGYTIICQIIVLAFMINELAIPLVDGADYWNMRAEPFILSWAIGFFSLMLCFILKSTHIGKCLFLVRSSLDTCEFVLIGDFGITPHPSEQDVLASFFDLLCNFASLIKLKLNIPDTIFMVPFEKYKTTAKYVYLEVKNEGHERLFYYECVRYSYSIDLGYFVDASHRAAEYLKNTNMTDLLAQGGLSDFESQKRISEIGKNVIAVETVTFWNLLQREISDPVFFLQLYLIIKSLYWKSIITAPIWGIMVAYTICKKVMIIHNQQRDLTELATNSANSTVTVLRQHVTKTVPASDLAIGDIVRVDSEWEVPSDMVMLRGDAIVDERCITGESVPLRKAKMSVEKYGYSLSVFDSNYTDSSKDKIIRDHLLKSGTRVIAVVGNKEIAASSVAVVVATGVYTTKGRQMKGVLFPNQFRLKYDTQLPTIFLLTFIYALICSSYQIQILGWTMSSLFYCLGTLSQVVPVWTSTIISIGQSRACERLSKSESICCIAPSRIAVCGKMRVMCFDKTGTLTNNSLLFNGAKLCSGKVPNMKLMSADVVASTFNSIRSINELTKTDFETTQKIVALAIASCHSLWPSQGTKQLGNQVDNSMFNSAGCTIEQYIDEEGVTRRFIKSSLNRDLVLEVLTTFDFDYQKKLSSVVISAKVGNEEPVLMTFVKGAYENVAMCCVGANTNIASVAAEEAGNGSYVLGLGYKVLSSPNDYQERESVESKLRMAGLLLFSNSIREQSMSVIQSLHETKVRPIILTGDNVSAAQFVATACGMYGDANKPGPSGTLLDGVVIWEYPQAKVNDEELYFGELYDNLSVTGDAFDYIEQHWDDILKAYSRLTDNKSANDYLFEQFLLRIRIFGRLNPHQKVRVINSFKSLGIITGMCGDGTNDCLALQASHAGVSLTNGVTSMVAPFTSKENKLESVISLIREGRGSLVTSLACFKFMLLFGLLIAFVKVMLFKTCRGVMPEWGYLLLENAILLCLSHTMTMSRPTEKLRIRSPTSSLLGPLTLFSVGIMFGVNVFFLLLFFKLLKASGLPLSLEYNRNISPAIWWILCDNYEAPLTCLWLCYQVVNSALAFSFGGHFRESVFKNYYLTGTWLAINSVLTFLLFSGPSKLTCLFRINCTDEVSRTTVIPFLRVLTTSANGMPFHGPVGHNVIPFRFKILFLTLNVVNAAVNSLITKFISWNGFLKEMRSIIGHKCSADRIKI
ncbi:bifunctional P-type ATPase [Babesia duncani]|uniref:Bifunctional P-type ATPase n=1 Tax=Babesia duncani TaxID=323732 RepID=A0AAD9UPF7_9APIC|nr:bifunctional P-type ATPase [Babesia duncani]